MLLKHGVPRGVSREPRASARVNPSIAQICVFILPRHCLFKEDMITIFKKWLITRSLVRQTISAARLVPIKHLLPLPFIPDKRWHPQPQPALHPWEIGASDFLDPCKPFIAAVSQPVIVTRPKCTKRHPSQSTESQTIVYASISSWWYWSITPSRVENSFFAW